MSSSTNPFTFLRGSSNMTQPILDRADQKREEKGRQGGRGEDEEARRSRRGTERKEDKGECPREGLKSESVSSFPERLPSKSQHNFGLPFRLNTNTTAHTHRCTANYATGTNRPTRAFQQHFPAPPGGFRGVPGSDGIFNPFSEVWVYLRGCQGGGLCCRVQPPCRGNSHEPLVSASPFFQSLAKDRVRS